MSRIRGSMTSAFVKVPRFKDLCVCPLFQGSRTSAYVKVSRFQDLCVCQGFEVPGPAYVKVSKFRDLCVCQGLEVCHNERSMARCSLVRNERADLAVQSAQRAGPRFQFGVGVPGRLRKSVKVSRFQDLCVCFSRFQDLCGCLSRFRSSRTLRMSRFRGFRTSHLRVSRFRGSRNFAYVKVSRFHDICVRQGSEVPRPLMSVVLRFQDLCVCHSMFRGSRTPAYVKVARFQDLLCQGFEVLGPLHVKVSRFQASEY